MREETALARASFLGTQGEVDPVIVVVVALQEHSALVGWRCRRRLSHEVPIRLRMLCEVVPLPVLPCG